MNSENFLKCVRSKFMITLVEESFLVFLPKMKIDKSRVFGYFFRGKKKDFGIIY
jgi:hypothetical protein